MSDGSNNLRRCEEVASTKSGEPPSSYGLPGRRFTAHDHAQDTLSTPRILVRTRIAKLDHGIPGGVCLSRLRSTFFMAHTTEEKKKLLNRVRRIRGQVEAIERTLDQEAECSEVLHNISACRGAMDALMAR